MNVNKILNCFTGETGYCIYIDRQLQQRKTGHVVSRISSFFFHQTGNSKS